MSTELHPTLTRYFEALRRMDFAGVAACFAADGLQEDPVGGGTRRGPAQVQAFFEQIGGLLSAVDLTPVRVYPAGNEIGVVWDAKGRGKNGVDVRFDGIDVIVLDAAGQIASLRAFWDAGTIIAKLSAPA